MFYREVIFSLIIITCELMFIFIFLYLFTDFMEDVLCHQIKKFKCLLNLL